MDDDEARQLLLAERARIEGLLRDTTESGTSDRGSATEPGDMTDSAEPMTSEQGDDAVAASLRSRLDALERAKRRLEDGTFGISVRSGRRIPDERLRADPAAELTVDEAEQAH